MDISNFSSGYFQLAQLPSLLNNSNMTGLKDLVAARLLAIGKNPFEAAKDAGLERSFINDILINKKLTVRGNGIAKLARAIAVDVESVIAAQSDKPILTKDASKLVASFDPEEVGGPPETTEIDLESKVDADIGRQSSKDLIREVDARLHGGAGGQVIDAWVHDDNGNSYAANGIRGLWKLPDAIMQGELHATPAQIRIFEVIGDSMQPVLFERDRVFIDTRMTDPHPPGIFALFDGDGLVIKRLQLVHRSDPPKAKIISANKDYQPYEALLSEVRIYGRLAGRFTTTITG